MRVPRRRELSDKLAASRAQEKRAAELYGGRRQPGSGNGPVRKGDVKAPSVLIENKRTDGASISIKATDLDKIRRQALSRGLVPLLGIEIGGRDYVLREAQDDRERDERIDELEAELARLCDRDDRAVPGGRAASA